MTLSPNHLINALWIFWFAGWMLLALKTNKTVSAQSAAQRTGHIVLVAGGCALLFGHDSPLPPEHPALSWLGAALTAWGIFHSYWARFHLGRLWSGVVTLKEEHKIVRTGPYALTRHPIYTGLLLAVAGTALAHWNVGGVPGFLLIAAGFRLKISQEEGILVEHFGDAYLKYRAEVPMLVPCPRKCA
jgi:protein-S-isoprenylcysteine O-methyltransferase Ste14